MNELGLAGKIKSKKAVINNDLFYSMGETKGFFNCLKRNEERRNTETSIVFNCKINQN